MKPALNCLTLAAFGLLTLAPSTFGLGQPQIVDFQASQGSFPLFHHEAARLLVDTNDWPGVIRATHDLAADLGRVTGHSATVDVIPPRSNQTAVIIGTLGKSALIQRLVEAHAFDPAPISGQWESSMLQVVPHPLPGIESALVICGSDKRGTIFGLYNLSEQIGVSPWYYWADVPPQHHDQLFVKAGKVISGPPSVKYRGIFLNDEAPALSGWIQEKYGLVPGQRNVANYGRGFYTNLFELMLRLRANYLWPAMWNNAFNEDDPQNPRLADEYGIVMGTSHQEPMLRAQKEWDRNLGRRHGNWNYNKTNQQPVLQQFWREGIRRNRSYESIITLGLRAENDSGAPIGRTLTEQIIGTQRDILSQEMNPNLSAIPQMWCLYKEVQDFYNEGLRVPDDITLLWAEDNWGNIRRLPSPEERTRPGGAGVYYHFDYHGSPRSYQWINTSPIPKIWDQLSLAKQYGADRIWIVNVGHFKGYEFPMEFFMHLACNVDRWNSQNLEDYTHLWAEREFGPSCAEEIASIVTRYTQFNGRRKPELLDANTYSLINYQEFDQAAADYNALLAQAEAVARRLTSERQDAFYELVLFPVKACAQLHALYLAAAKNAHYARQHRASANDFADQVQSLFIAQTNLMDHFNRVLAGGKWNRFMDQAHLGYTGWSDPPQNSLRAIHLARLALTNPPTLAISVEGSRSAWTNGDNPTLPAFDAFNRQRRFVDVFNQGQDSFTYSVTTSAPWLRVTNEGYSGPNPVPVEKERRVWVSVDWASAPAGASAAEISFKSAAGAASVQLQVFNPTNVTAAALEGFVETDGCVSMEAQHFNRNTPAGSNTWSFLPHYGHTLSSMRAQGPADTLAVPDQSSPCLEYRMFLFSTGQLKVDSILGPTLNFLHGRPLRYAIAFDSQPPQTITAVPAGFNAQNGNREWEESVKQNCRHSVSTHTIDQPGYHTLKIWMVDPGLVLQKLIVDTGGVRPSYLGPPESFRGSAETTFSAQK
jgi:hypothetical protein